MVTPFSGSVAGNSPHYGLINFHAEKEEQDKSTPKSKDDTFSEPGIVIEPARELSSDIKIHCLTPSTLFDLELMHHYTRLTYLTITDLEYTIPTWQDAMPKEALSHPFLMHGILSLAAFHIAVLQPQKRKAYIDRGMQHYTLALTLYREVLMNSNQNNCHALFAFSSLGAIISFAVSMVSRHTHGAIIQDIQDTFSMLRGIHAVVMVTRHWIQHGPMSTLLRGYTAKDYDLPIACQEYLQTLEDRVRSSEPDEERSNAYLEAIEVGRKALKNVAVDPNDKTLAFTWPIMVSRPYFDALHERRPLALAVLGLYGVILHDVRMYWWAEDRGMKLIEAVHASLDETWEDVIRYPISLMNLLPTPRSSTQLSSNPDRLSFSPPQISPSIKFESMG